MSHHNTAFHQLLKPLCRHEFERLAQAHHVGQKLRSVSRWDQFVGMAMSQLSGRQSLRDIQSNLEAQQHKLYHLGAKPIARSSLARVNEKQPAELYQALFYKLLNRCQRMPSNHQFRFKNPLYSLDASAIDLSLKLFPWAAHRQDTANVKLSVGLNHGSQLPEFVALSDGNENDMVKGRTFEFPQGSIVAFDKGYVDYQWFRSLTDKGVFFVTRLRTKAVYKVLERRKVDRSQGILSDQVIQLNSAHALKRGAPVLRRVGFRDSETGQFYQFLTNNLALSASTIAAIYKERWQVELFFKAIKQNLKIKTFVGLSKNAVLTQIWIAMITYLLVAFARHSAKAGWTVQRIMRVIQLNLFERRTLREILNPDPPRQKKGEPQMRFAL
ncbi:MAG TPA: IS4 family transposase [Gammaproteobacteria bacterium]|nr:IS4 family transposase [Gammaproteobacteria bacterium]